MKRWFFLFAVPPFVSACTDSAPKAVTCPTAPVDVLRVSFNQTEGRYSVFHTTTPGAVKIANPLLVENLQMVQIPADANQKNDYARMSFKAENGKCNPLLEMTQGYKIELAQGATRAPGESGSSSGSSGAGGSSWAPFLMGAVAGHVLSNALSPPAYYLPPPAGQQGGTVTGGVAANSPAELNKKYESQYNQPAKKGFFSSSRSSSAEGGAPEKKGGFFNRKSNPSHDSNRSRGGGFFKKR